MSQPHEVDESALQDLLRSTGNDSAFVSELIDTYLTDSRELLVTMRQAIRDGNTEQLRKAAHTLKSSSASLGAGAVARLCLEVEQQARAGALAAGAEYLASIEAAQAAAEHELHALRLALP